MATWDDKDPRWLVSDRKDGANVNGWHWEERNMMGWSRDKLTELLVGLVADIRPEQGAAELTELKDLKGEALLTRRKSSKKFSMYDLTVTVIWKGHWVDDESKQVTGQLIIKEFASTNDPDEYELECTADGSGTAQDQLKGHVVGLKPQIWKQLQQYADAIAQQ